MTRIKEYLDLRAQLKQLNDCIAHHTEAIRQLTEQVDKIQDQMYDMECCDLSAADMAEISRCDRLGVDP